MGLKSTSDVGKYLQFENKCNRLLRNDEIRFVGIINNMGNLISGGFSDGIDLLENDEQRILYMQMALEIAMRKDYDDTLGKINYVTTNRDNVLMVTIPMNNYVVLISANPASIPEQIIAKAHALGLIQSVT
ncbi:hypothetical protein YTPLAS73_12630 [Nitrosarchaeum sp.]|nr:hypothetical protein YTPLAS73_12630 [Nitrosarchaeum sp.]